MAGLKLHERGQIWQLSAREACRASLARALGSPLLRWRYGAPIGEQILLVPQELRSGDPSFAKEMADGQMGLAGQFQHLRGAGPFDALPPNDAWARELHGFSWLRHLRAAGTPEAAGIARRLVGEWLARGRRHDSVAREPAVIGRRITAWLGHSDLLLEGVDKAHYDRTLQSLADQLIELSSAWRAAPEGLPRLSALVGLVYGDLCIAGHDAHLAVAERLLSDEIGRQIRPDGGHVSRDTGVLVEILLDLLPLRQCFATLARPFPAQIETAMGRMMAMVRYMRLGDGSLARFNGVGASPVDELAAVLAYDAIASRPLQSAPHSRYVRLEQRPCILIADVGGSPPLLHAGRAGAGCLSFELSIGSQPVLVNCGMPGVGESKYLSAARSTASHNTLALGDHSSARRVVDAGLARMAGGEPLVLAGDVTSRLTGGPDGDQLDAAHAGYVELHRVQHRRRLKLLAEGRGLEGRDSLAGPTRAVRLERDVPFAIHFHLAPLVDCSLDGDDARAVVLRLPDGTRWRFAAEGAELSLEPGLHFAGAVGARPSRQIVLRGACWGETEVGWSLLPARD